MLKAESFKTREDCRNAIAALGQRQKDLEGVREFRITEHYCVGGADEPYTLQEAEALALLRSELHQADGIDDSAAVDALSYEELSKRLGRGRGRFDVTREGCHSSELWVEPIR